eukprot:440073-Rhodomonas_salina.5
MQLRVVPGEWGLRVVANKFPAVTPICEDKSNALDFEDFHCFRDSVLNAIKAHARYAMPDTDIVRDGASLSSTTRSWLQVPRLLSRWCKVRDFLELNFSYFVVLMAVCVPNCASTYLTLRLLLQDITRSASRALATTTSPHSDRR